MGGGERTQSSPLPFQSKGVPDRLVEVRDGLGGGEVEVGGRGQNALRSPLWPPQGPRFLLYYGHPAVQITGPPLSKRSSPPPK